MFELLKTDAHTKARLGRLTTAHGVVDTPVYMPVGTQGSVKTLEIPGNRGWMVIALGEVDRPNPKDIDPRRVAAIAQPLGPAFGNELVGELVAEAKRRAGVKINKDLLEQLRKELTGTAPAQ